MGQFIEFAKILENKIREELRQELLSETEIQTSPSQNVEIPLWESLNLGLNPVHFTSLAQGKTYHRQRLPPQPRPAHLLNETQTKAYQFFQDHGVRLNAGFSSRELKAAFRQLALKLHPDQGGSSQGLQQLVQARHSLSLLFS